MRRLLVCLSLALALAFAAAAADVTGKWAGTYSLDNGDSGQAFLDLKQSGSTVTGSAGPEAPGEWPLKEGRIDGNKLVITVESPDHGTYKLDLTLSGDNLKGGLVASMPDGGSVKGKLDLNRVK